MAAMLAQPVPVSLPIAENPVAPTVVRKRRRRAPATGAADDCFSCQGKGLKCDRKRPYCGPCLEAETDCGGYKTQLTWGVGVASRGKLRGMTLPISLETAPSIPGLERKVQPKKRSPSVEKAVPVSRKTKAMKDIDCMDEDAIASSAPENKRLSIASNYDFSSVASPSTNSSSASLSTSVQNAFPIQQQNTQVRPSIQTSLHTTTSSSYPSFQPISPPSQEFPMSLQLQHKSGFPMSTHSTPSSPVLLSPMSEYEPSFGGMHSPFALSPVNSNGSLFEMGMDSTATSAYHPMSMTATSGPGTYGSLHSELASSMHHGGGFSSFNQHHFHRHSSVSHSFGGSELAGSHPQMHAGSGNLSALLYGDDMLGLEENEYQFSPPTYANHMPTSCPSGMAEPSQAFQPSLHEGTPHAASPMHIPSLLPPQLANKSPELRYLVDYYDRTVCPSLVTFDGPGNPYRSHILRMAFHNDALMEAVYALASSHLHQRRNGIKVEPSFSTVSYGTPESTSMISPIDSLDDIHGSQQANWGRSPSVPDIDFFDGGASEPHGVSASLEHKNSSIRMLNAQLANPALATTDSAMATLLLLCLYHVCETGQGQFRTHLAGVKKLMSMRGAGNANQRWTWMETVFTWLENMSAPMNNRFSQLDASEYMESICEQGGDWDIESLTGCDRELFAKISKLSMVNMLSQQPANNANRRWMVPSEQEEDEWEQPKRNEDDGRVEFWQAWNALRNDLSNWEPSPRFAATSSRQRMSDSVSSISSIQTVDSGFASLNSTSPNSPVLSGYRTGASFSPRKMSFKAQEAVETNHWLHASNVHRSAALLYLDRLAYPHLSSSHPIFQNTVRKVLDHMTCIPTSSALNKTLFWPLFVTASECVVDAHREQIRQRCYSMQAASGFYNKVVGLDVLERIWSEDEDMLMGGLDTDESIGGRGLKWRKITAMDDGTEFLFI